MNSKAIEVLQRAKEEVIREIIRAGESGGVGRAQNFSPILNNLHESIRILQDTLVIDGREPSFAEKMQAAKAAKKQSAQ